MNKMLFALLFASVSFCATQDASAGNKPPKKKNEVLGTAHRRHVRIDPAKIAQMARQAEEQRRAQKEHDERIMKEEAERAKCRRVILEEIERIKRGENVTKPAAVRRLFVDDSEDQY